MRIELRWKWEKEEGSNKVHIFISNIYFALSILSNNSIDVFGISTTFEADWEWSRRACGMRQEWFSSSITKEFQSCFVLHRLPLTLYPWNSALFTHPFAPKIQRVKHSFSRKEKAKFLRWMELRNACRTTFSMKFLSFFWSAVWFCSSIVHVMRC